MTNAPKSALRQHVVAVRRLQRATLSVLVKSVCDRQTLGMSGFRRIVLRSSIAGLVSISLVFQALLMAWSGPLMAAMQADEAGPLSQTIIICTSDGIRRVTLDQNGSPVVPSDRSPGDATCIICLSLANSPATLIPAVTTHIVLPSFDVARYAIIEQVLSDRRPHVRCGLDPPVLS